MTSELNEAAAAVLDGAHDYMLVNGWCQSSFENSDGNVCVYGAIHRFESVQRNWAAKNRAKEALCETVSGGLVMCWNDQPGRTMDDALDLFRHAAKNLRNQ